MHFSRYACFSNAYINVSRYACFRMFLHHPFILSSFPTCSTAPLRKGLQGCCDAVRHWQRRGVRPWHWRGCCTCQWMLPNCCPTTQPMKWHPFVPVSRQFSNHKTVCVLLEWIFAKWQKFEGILWSLNGLISESACWGMIPCDFHDVSFMALKYPECHHFQQFPETVLSLVFKILRRFFYTHHLLLQASNTRKVSICINTSNQKTSKKVPLSLMFTTKPPRPLFAWLWSLEIRALHLHISHIRLYNLITY